jgi:Holliday junction resolvase RusA-like endonuclease
MELSSLRIDIKPLSINEAFQGRRFKTPAYRKYERDVLLLLRPMEIPEGPLTVEIDWGMSSEASDIDNPCKPFVDILQKRYGFDDKRIERLLLTKTKVKRGQEYVEFQIRACRTAP